MASRLLGELSLCRFWRGQHFKCFTNERSVDYFSKCQWIAPY